MAEGEDEENSKDPVNGEVSGLLNTPDANNSAFWHRKQSCHM